MELLNQNTAVEVIGMCSAVWETTTCDVTCYAEIAAVRNFLAMLLLEEVPPMLLQSPDEPLFIHLPQDYGDLSAGWKCFQKALISLLVAREDP